MHGEAIFIPIRAFQAGTVGQEVDDLRLADLDARLPVLESGVPPSSDQED